MKNKLLNKIFNKDSQSFKNSRCLENVRKTTMTAIVFIAYMFWLLFIRWVTTLANPTEEFVSISLLVYGIFLAVNFAALFLSRRIIKTYSKTQTVKKSYDLFVFLYVSLIMMYGAAISILDQQQYGHIIVYIILVLISMSYFNLDTKVVMIPFSLSAFALIVGLFYVQTNDNVLRSHYINLILFLPVIFLISRFFYQEYKQKHAFIGKLEQETEINRKLNSDLEKANDILTKLATIDELTGISNRRGLNHFLELTLEMCLKKSIPVSSLLIDIDFFKEYNDNYGHFKGDEALRHFARQLNAVSKELSAFVARWGGEEFIIVSYGMTALEAESCCKKISVVTEQMNIEHQFSKVSEKLTVSVGTCTMYVNSRDDLDKCIEFTDRALYYAKEEGRNRYKNFDFVNKSGIKDKSFKNI